MSLTLSIFIFFAEAAGALNIPITLTFELYGVPGDLPNCFEQFNPDSARLHETLTLVHVVYLFCLFIFNDLRIFLFDLFSEFNPDSAKLDKTLTLVHAHTRTRTRAHAHAHPRTPRMQILINLSIYLNVFMYLSM
jgi:hypothetical protein